MSDDRRAAVIRGGKHDGMEGRVAAAVIEARFLPVVETDPDGTDMVYGYRLSGRDPQGRWVFVPNGAGETS